jgi:uncharacterized membrane protein
MALIAVGLCWHAVRSGGCQLDDRLQGMDLFDFLLTEIHIAARGQGRPRPLVDAGIAVPMLTPYLRVLASMLYFMFGQRYSVFTAIVLGVLTFSLFAR